MTTAVTAVTAITAITAAIAIIVTTSPIGITKFFDGDQPGERARADSEHLMTALGLDPDLYKVLFKHIYEDLYRKAD